MDSLLNLVLWVFISLGGFTFGYDTGLISGILEMESFNRDFGNTIEEGIHDLSPVTQSLVVSSLSLGTLLGSILAGWICDRMGRRTSILISCGIFSVGIGSQTISQTKLILIVGRLIAGIGLGLLSHVIPLYQSEIVRDKDKTTLIWTYQLNITCGLLIAFIVNFTTAGLDGAHAYRLPIGLQLSLAFLICVCIVFLPESPSMLIRWGEVEKAKETLSQLWKLPHDHVIISETIHTIQNALSAKQSLRVFSSGLTLKRIGIAMGVQFFQQLTGINFIFYYGIVFFNLTGSNRAYLIQILAGAVNVVFSVPGLFLASRLSRRKILLFGAFVMLIGHLGLGLAIVCGHSITSQEPFLIAATMIFVSGFAFSWGPTAWIVSTEIFPVSLRTEGITLAAISNWSGNLLVAICAPFLLDLCPLQTLGFLWAFLILCGILFVYFLVPETSGLSAEDIDELFESRIPAFRSVQWVPSSILFRSGLDESSISGTYSKVY